MKKIIVLTLVLALTGFALPAFAQEDAASYQDNMKKDLVRGFKNIIGSPLEIPITIQEYHQKEGKPVVRHVAGLVDGVFQGVVRFGSGAWDFLAAFLPGHQEGMPADPETLF